MPNYGEIADYYEEIALAQYYDCEKILKKYKRLKEKKINIFESQLCNQYLEYYLNQNNIYLNLIPLTENEKEIIKNAKECTYKSQCKFSHNVEFKKFAEYIIIFQNRINSKYQNNTRKKCLHEMNFMISNNLFKSELTNQLQDILWTEDEIKFLRHVKPCKYGKECKFNHIISIDDILENLNFIRKKITTEPIIEWSCFSCGKFNFPNNKYCDVCGNLRSYNLYNFCDKGWKCFCGFINFPSIDTCVICSRSEEKLIYKGEKSSFNFYKNGYKWLCIKCYKYNDLNKKCYKCKYEPKTIINNEWKLEKYNREINNIKKWKIRSRFDDEEELKRLYDRSKTTHEKIYYAQNILFHKYTKNDKYIKWQPILGDYISPKFKDYIIAKINNESTRKIGNEIKKEIIKNFALNLKINHIFLLLEISQITNISQIKKHVNYAYNKSKKYCENYMTKPELYKKSFEYLENVVIELYKDRDILSLIIDQISERYNIDTNLNYPVIVKKYNGFVKDPFFDGRVNRKNVIKHNAEDKYKLLHIIFNNYVYDNVKLVTKYSKKNVVDFCWAWCDNSW